MPIAVNDWSAQSLGHELLIAVVTIGLSISSAIAGPFTELVIFGDSLSDVGNTSQASFGTYPGQFYSNGRFSNGPVYVEAVATGLGLSPTVRSTAGGSNFAYGGARRPAPAVLKACSYRTLTSRLTSFSPRHS